MHIEASTPIEAERDAQTKGKRFHYQRRRRQLPWLRCLHCGSRLVQIDMHLRSPCIRLNTHAVLLKGKVECVHCGTVRTFQSRPPCGEG